MISKSITDSAKFWRWTGVPMAAVIQVKNVTGESNGLLYSDLGIYAAMGLWGRVNGRITRSRTAMAKDLGIGRRTLYDVLERLHAAGAIRWEEAVGKDGQTIRNVVMLNHTQMDESLADEANPGADVRNSEHEPDEEGVRSVAQGVCGQPHSSVRSAAHRSRSTKRIEDEDSAPPTALPSGLVNLKNAAEEDEEETEGRTEKKKKAKERATRSAPPSPGGTNVPPRQISKMVELEKPRGRGRKSGKRAPKKAAVRNPAIDELLVVWATEVKACYPDYAVPVSTHKQIGQARHLFNQFGAENATKIIRVAVWDLPEIQETVEVWKTKDTPVPDIGDILYLGTKLAAFVKRGVGSPRRRVSEYAKRFVTKQPSPEKVKEDNDKFGGLSAARYYQNIEHEKKKKKRDAWKAEQKKLREEEAKREANRRPDGSYR